MGFTVTGLDAMFAFFTTVTQQAKKAGQTTWWVGTVVYYGPYLEFGTENFQNKPHWRPAIQELAAELGLDGKTSEEAIQTLMVPDGNLVRVIAIALEAKVKEWIRRQNLIDTGNYRGSVTSGPTVSAMKAASMANLLDPSTASPV